MKCFILLLVGLFVFAHAKTDFGGKLGKFYDVTEKGVIEYDMDADKHTKCVDDSDYDNCHGGHILYRMQKSYSKTAMKLRVYGAKDGGTGDPHYHEQFAHICINMGGYGGWNTSTAEWGAEAGDISLIGLGQVNSHEFLPARMGSTLFCIYNPFNSNDTVKEPDEHWNPWPKPQEPRTLFDVGEVTVYNGEGSGLKKIDLDDEYEWIKAQDGFGMESKCYCGQSGGLVTGMKVNNMNAYPCICTEGGVAEAQNDFHRHADRVDQIFVVYEGQLLVQYNGYTKVFNKGDIIAHEEFVDHGVVGFMGDCKIMVLNGPALSATNRFDHAIDSHTKGNDVFKQAFNAAQYAYMMSPAYDDDMSKYMEKQVLKFTTCPVETKAYKYPARADITGTLDLILKTKHIKVGKHATNRYPLHSPNDGGFMMDMFEAVVKILGNEYGVPISVEWIEGLGWSSIIDTLYWNYFDLMYTNMNFNGLWNTSTDVRADLVDFLCTWTGSSKQFAVRKDSFSTIPTPGVADVDVPGMTVCVGQNTIYQDWADSNLVNAVVQPVNIDSGTALENLLDGSIYDCDAAIQADPVVQDFVKNHDTTKSGAKFGWQSGFAGAVRNDPKTTCGAAAEPTCGDVKAARGMVTKLLACDM